KDFDVLGGPFSSQRSNVSITGSTVVQSVSVTHSYVLKPRKTGSLVIPPATAKDAAGHTYESNSVPIQVVNGSLANQRPAPKGFDPFDDPFEAMMQQRRQAMQQRQQQRQQQPQSQ